MRELFYAKWTKCHQISSDIYRAMFRHLRMFASRCWTSKSWMSVKYVFNVGIEDIRVLAWKIDLFLHSICFVRWLPIGNKCVFHNSPMCWRISSENSRCFPASHAKSPSSHTYTRECHQFCSFSFFLFDDNISLLLLPLCRCISSLHRVPVTKAVRWALLMIVRWKARLWDRLGTCTSIRSNPT